MEVYESFSRALLRRRYKRIDTGGVAVRRRRVKVAHLQADADVVRRTSHRQRLRCFRLRFLVPERLVAGLKAACVKLVQQVVECRGKRIEPAPRPPQPVLLLPRDVPLRSSSNDVVNEVWFQQALRRSIAEGRITIKT